MFTTANYATDMANRAAYMVIDAKMVCKYNVLPATNVKKGQRVPQGKVPALPIERVSLGSARKVSAAVSHPVMPVMQTSPAKRSSARDAPKPIMTPATPVAKATANSGRLQPCPTLPQRTRTVTRRRPA